MNKNNIRVTIEVTAQKIKKAVEALHSGERYTRSCPVAQGINPLLRKGYVVGVGITKFFVCAKGSDKEFTGKLPEKAQLQIAAYDLAPRGAKAGAFKPISFSVVIPRKFVRPSVVALAERLNKAAANARRKARNRNLNA